jgi:drug/metabolite transporter (DMT)-like permease
MFSRKFSISSSSFCIGGLSVCLILLPVNIFYFDYLPAVNSQSLLIVALSSVFQAIYFFGVVNAYKYGNLSLAYPLLRSIPILMVLFYVFTFEDASSISIEAVAGGLLIILGCILLPMRHLKDFALDNYVNKMMLFVLLAALGTAGYSVLDSLGMKALASTSPEVSMMLVSSTYIYLQVLFTSLLLGVISLSNRKSREEFINVLSTKKTIAFIISGMTMLSYAPILVAMTLVTNVTYVVAFRQASIPIAFLLGVIFLKEVSYRIRWIAVIFILLGLVISALY